MADVKFDKIVSCSSEDPDFPAANLLKAGEDSAPWRTGKEGESSATVVIQLDRRYCISQLEIKNDLSAFIEVLVANQTDSEDPRFQVLLSASSFMTPNESKNLLNVQRSRVFDKDKLSPSALKLTFDLVKINCTQPFNKTLKYGLSWIKATEGEVSSSPVAVDTSPGIKLRSIENKDKDIATSSTPVIAQSDRKALDFDKDDDAPNPTKMAKLTGDEDDQSAPSQKAVDISVTQKDDDKPSAANKPIKAKSQDAKPKAIAPFCQLMNGVTFTISGFQNPLRSEIRSKGLQMGARYRGDWDDSCTHLICAFPNTPKYNQVVGTGKLIITKEWIEDSYNNRKLMPWKRYDLQAPSAPKRKGTVKKRQDESESDEDEDSEMDDFICDDSDDDADFDPNHSQETDDENAEDLDRLGPVVQRKLRDDGGQKPVDDDISGL